MSVAPKRASGKLDPEEMSSGSTQESDGMSNTYRVSENPAVDAYPPKTKSSSPLMAAAHDEIGGGAKGWDAVRMRDQVEEETL